MADDTESRAANAHIETIEELEARVHRDWNERAASIASRLVLMSDAEVEDLHARNRPFAGWSRPFADPEKVRAGRDVIRAVLEVMHHGDERSWNWLRDIARRAPAREVDDVVARRASVVDKVGATIEAWRLRQWEQEGVISPDHAITYSLKEALESSDPKFGSLRHKQIVEAFQDLPAAKHGRDLLPVAKNGHHESTCSIAARLSVACGAFGDDVVEPGDHREESRGQHARVASLYRKAFARTHQGDDVKQT